MGWRDWLGVGKARKTQADSDLLSSPGPIEGTPHFLAQVYLYMVGVHMNLLEDLEKTGFVLTEDGDLTVVVDPEKRGYIVLTEDQKTHIFRQLCLFYDALW